jgi:hypothetical protein
VDSVYTPTLPEKVPLARLLPQIDKNEYVKTGTVWLDLF